MKIRYFDPLTHEPCTRRAYLKAWKAIAAEVSKRLSVDIVGYDELNNGIGDKHRTLALPFWIISRLYEARPEQLPAKTTFDSVLSVSDAGTAIVHNIPTARVAALWAYANKRLLDEELGSLAQGRTAELVSRTGSVSYYKVTWTTPAGNKLSLQRIRGVEFGFKDFIDTGFSLE